MKRVGLSSVVVSTAILWTLNMPAGAVVVDTIYPEMARTTIIEGEGIVGITMLLPRNASLHHNDMRLSVSGDTDFAWVLVKQNYTIDSGPLKCDFCFSSFAQFHRGYADNDLPLYGGCTNADFQEIGCPHEAGPLEIYVVSDGRFRFTMIWPELQGATKVLASAEIDGALERIPVRCDPSLGCSHLYGSSVHDIGLDNRPGVAVVSMWIKNGGPFSLNPSLSGSQACAYPNISFPEKTADPDTHPNGCDITDSGSLPYDVGSTSGGPGKGQWMRANHGPQYLGFRIVRQDTIGEIRWDVMGFWLTAGLACPSGDFNDCFKTDSL